MYYTDKVIKKFHSCNAHTEYYKDAEMFVSGVTAIATIRYDESTSTAYLSLSWAFSSSDVRKQFSRWLREHGLDCAELKDVPDDRSQFKANEGLYIRSGFEPAVLNWAFNEGTCY